jgi:hypothetical protein
MFRNFRVLQISLPSKSPHMSNTNVNKAETLVLGLEAGVVPVDHWVLGLREEIADL